MKLHLLLLIFAVMPIMSFGQVFVTGNLEGADYRDVLVAKIIVNATPKDSVEQWLVNKAFMTITVSTDTSGYLKNILKVRSKKNRIPQQLVLQWQKYWIESGVKIPASFYDSHISAAKHKKLAIQGIRERARKGCDSIIQTIGFPPECIYSKVYNQTDSCNYLEILKCEIDNYLDQVLEKLIIKSEDN